MLIAIDVGNTNIVLGVFEGDQLTESWRLQTMRERTADELGILMTHLFERSRIDLSKLQGIILASVVLEHRHAGPVSTCVGCRSRSGGERRRGV
jgi:type III pantothenate kinase